jgi:hypothetical protein
LKTAYWAGMGKAQAGGSVSRSLRPCLLHGYIAVLTMAARLPKGDNRMKRHFYAARHAGGRIVDYLRFAHRHDREQWVNDGWGRIPVRAASVPAGLEWQAEELFFTRPASRVIVAAASAMPARSLP